MTKILNIPAIANPGCPIGASRSKMGVVDNTGTEPVTLTSITNLLATYETLELSLGLIFPKPPVSTSVYLDTDLNFVDSTGAFYTALPAAGHTIGTTDSNGKITVSTGTAGTSEEVNFEIVNPENTRLYGAYYDGSDWVQSSGDTPDAVAILNEVPTIAGTYIATLYYNTESFDAPNIQATFMEKFTPVAVSYSYSYMTTVSDATIEDIGNTFWVGYAIDDIDQTDYEKTVDVYINPDGLGIEIDEEAHDFKSTNKFDSLVYTLIFTDGRAPKHRKAGDLRGWLGDILGETFKSLVWTKGQSRLTRRDINKIEAYIKTALQYMVTHEICRKVEVEAVQDNTRGIGANIRIYTLSGSVDIYVPIWKETDK